MNPLTNMKNVTKLSEQELSSTSKSSWHDQYKDSAWLFVGGLPFDLSEGDIICIFSQYGEVVNINLIRAKDTGKSKGFCFLCYEDQRSTVLAVDNLNGIKILNRSIRVDHVSEYKIPKEHKNTDDVTKQLYNEGCAPKAKPICLPPSDIRETIADVINSDIKLPARLPIYTNIKTEKSDSLIKGKKEKKKKKDKKKKGKKKKAKKQKSSDLSDSSSEDSSSDEDKTKSKIKKEKLDSPDKKSSYSESSRDAVYRKNMSSSPKRRDERHRSRSNDKHKRSRSRSYERKDYSKKYKSSYRR